MSKYVKVSVSHHYIVPNNEVAIDYAKEALQDDLSSNHGLLSLTWFEATPVSDKPSGEVPVFIKEYLEEIVEE